MNSRQLKATAGALLLFGAAACADLVVDNTNAPDRRRALATPGDVESLVAGAYRSWYGGEEFQSNTAGTGAAWMGVASFMWSSTAANLGMNEYSKLPRVPIQNSATHADYGYISDSWTKHYRALASINDGLRTIQSDTAVSNALEEDRVLRARIFGKFVQGLAHGSIALMYDKGYVVDEGKEIITPSGAPVDLGEPVTYQVLMNAALAKLDTTIMLATANPDGLEIPASWVGSTEDVDMAMLVKIANSFKARYRANVARTLAERQAVNWNQVLAEVGAGVHADWMADRSVVFPSFTGQSTLQYMQLSTYQQLTYFIHGMADTSGSYQAWLALPLASRDANISGAPVLIRTPDKRFPQGETQAAQVANKGKYFHIRTNTAGTAASVAFQWTQPTRGTWRWSWYASRELDGGKHGTGLWPELPYAEMRMLAAEALFRTGNLAAAADSVNVTRVANGLNATNSAGLNTSCVPRLPNGTCGNLFEMLKWEKRMELWAKGPYKASWYFDGRGWNDLYRGTALQLPIPEEQSIVLGLGAAYTFGGVGGQSASTGSTYAWPGE
jgi:hypothetical protein